MSRPAFGRAKVLVSSPTKLKKKKNQRVKLDPRTPAAARLKINRLRSINRPAYGCTVNKTFNKRKNRAPLTVRRSQKHYEIFGNNVLRENVTRKQLRLRDSKLAQCLGRKRFSHSLHSVVARFVYLAPRRKGLITDPSDEYIFGYVQRVLTRAEVLFFPQKTQPLLLAR